MTAVTSQHEGKLELYEGAPLPAIKWEKLYPQIFKRGGEIRTPKGPFKSKDKAKELNRRATNMRKLSRDLFGENPILRIITEGGGVWIEGAALDEFLMLEDNGLEDLIFSGWIVSMA